MRTDGCLILLREANSRGLEAELQKQKKAAQRQEQVVVKTEDHHRSPSPPSQPDALLPPSSLRALSLQIANAKPRARAGRYLTDQLNEQLKQSAQQLETKSHELYTSTLQLRTSEHDLVRAESY